MAEEEDPLGEEEEAIPEAVEGEEVPQMARVATDVESKGILQVIARNRPNAMDVWRLDTSVQTVQTKERDKKR